MLFDSLIDFFTNNNAFAFWLGVISSLFATFLIFSWEKILDIGRSLAGIGKSEFDLKLSGYWMVEFFDGSEAVEFFKFSRNGHQVRFRFQTYFKHGKKDRGRGKGSGIYSRDSLILTYASDMDDFSTIGSWILYVSSEGFKNVLKGHFFQPAGREEILIPYYESVFRKIPLSYWRRILLSLGLWMYKSHADIPSNIINILVNHNQVETEPQPTLEEIEEFCQHVVSSESLWLVHNNRYPLTISDNPDERILPVWSSYEQAQKATEKFTVYQAFRLDKFSWKRFREQIVPMLDEDKTSLGVNLRALKIIQKGPSIRDFIQTVESFFGKKFDAQQAQEKEIANAISLIHEGTTQWISEGDCSVADELYDLSLATFQKLNIEMGMAYVNWNKGHLAFEQSDYEKAESLFKDSLAMFGKSHDQHRLEVVFTLDSLAGVAAKLNQFVRAFRLMSMSETLRTKYGVLYPPVWEEWRKRFVTPVYQNVDKTQRLTIKTRIETLTIDEAVAFGIYEGGE